MKQPSISIISSLKPLIRGDVLQPTNKNTEDFCLRKRELPLVVVHSAYAQDIPICYDFARKKGLSMAFRGAGHSTNGRNHAPGGILFHFKPSAENIVLQENATVLSSGHSLLEIEQVLNSKSVMLPVSPDYLGLRIGGTLTAGGYGIRSVQDGAQVSHVNRIQLIMPNGQQFWCSPHEHSSLFSLSLATIAPLGFIHKIEIKTQPYPADCRVVTYKHNSLKSLAKSLTWLNRLNIYPIQQFDFTYFNTSGLLTSRYAIDTHLNPSIEQFPDLSSDSLLIEDKTYPHYRIYNHQHVESWKNVYSKDYKLWTSYFVGIDKIEEYLMFMDEIRQQPLVHKYLKCLYISAIKRNPADFEFAFEARNTNGASMDFLIGLCLMIPPDQGSEMNLIYPYLDKCLEKCFELGGRPYLEGSHRLDKSHYDRYYSEAMNLFTSQKEKIDPDGILRFSL